MTPQRLDVTLDVEDVAAAGTLLFTVFNPTPGGGTSKQLTVDVTPPDAGEPPATPRKGSS